MRYFEILAEAKSPAAKQAIINRYGSKLEDRIKQDNREKELSVEDLLVRMEEADPTPKSAYVDWLVREYIRGNIRYIEDIGKAAEFLPRYEKLKPKLPVEQRNVLAFDFSGLWDFVRSKEDVDTRSKSEAKNDYEENLIKTGQAKILLNTDWKVVEIHSEDAAKFYGKNTKWCTAAENNNMFDAYYTGGRPLFVALHKASNKRWQYHPKSGQFMDEEDEPFVETCDVISDKPQYKLNWKFLDSAGKFPDIVIPKNVKDFCRDTSTPLTMEGVKFFKTYTEFRKHYHMFHFADDKVRVFSNPESIKDVKQTPELCLVAVKLQGHTLYDVKEQTPELCMTAVKQNGMVLMYVREQTPEICLAAVNQCGFALSYVKEQTPEICLAAVKQRGMALDKVREQTPELCMAAVKQDGTALKYVKEQTPELCMVAVNQNVFALEYVKKQTPELCMAAVKKDRRALWYVKPEFKTPEVIAAAEN